MSAFHVGPIHIDALLTGLLAGQRLGGPLHWLDPAVRADPQWSEGFEAGEMQGPAAPGLYESYGRDLTPDSATTVGVMLLAENARSISFRYDEDEDLTDAAEYLYKQLPGVPTVPVLAKALACYTYQSCEHPGWASSEAYCFVIAARSLLLDMTWRDDDPWHITSPTVFVDAAQRA